MNGFFLKSCAATIAAIALIALSCGSSRRTQGKFGEDFPWIWTVGLKPTERAAFEAESKRGAVLVRYESPETIEILPGCGEFGEYEFIESTRTMQNERIRSQEEILAKFPLNAIKLAKEYSQGTEWAFQYTIIGMSTVKIAEDELELLEDNCGRATHYVRSMAIGAFELISETPEKGAAAAFPRPDSDAGVADLNAPRSQTIEEYGDFAACSSDKILAGDPACQAIIKLYLEPL